MLDGARRLTITVQDLLAAQILETAGHSTELRTQSTYTLSLRESEGTYQLQMVDIWVFIAVVADH
jgi:hypothetical protein